MTPEPGAQAEPRKPRKPVEPGEPRKPGEPGETMERGASSRRSGRRAGHSGRPPGRGASWSNGAPPATAAAFFPRVLCPFCGGASALESARGERAGQGACSVVEHRPEAAGAAFARGEPYCIALVDLRRRCV